MKNKIVFMGTPEFSVPSLQALLDNDFRVVAVYTQPDRKVGRGQQVAASAVKQLALARGLNIIQIEKFSKEGNIERLAELAPELIVVAAFGIILPAVVLQLPRYGCINVHPSLLPRYRGASPVATAILRGDNMTGVTIMLLDEGMDTGHILNQKEVPISDEDTTGTLGTKLSKIGAEMLVETLPLWIEGRIKTRDQNEKVATYSKMIRKEDGNIDWRLTTKELWCQVRAYDPWPGSYTVWHGKRLKMVKVLPIYNDMGAEPGKVVVLFGKTTTIGVGTGKGILGLLMVQLEGKREMTAEEFAHGQRDFIGSSLL
jgi:methionyl-tRNA formyltransferase